MTIPDPSGEHPQHDRNHPAAQRPPKDTMPVGETVPAKPDDAAQPDSGDSAGHTTGNAVGDSADDAILAWLADEPSGKPAGTSPPTPANAGSQLVANNVRPAAVTPAREFSSLDAVVTAATSFDAVSSSDSPEAIHVSGGADRSRERERPPDQPTRKRRVLLPISLFLLTCVSTFFAGACQWWPAYYLFFVRPMGNYDSPLRRVIWAHWDDGLIYMGCVLAILLTHEMGHFLATVRYRVPASLPFFLPLPISPIGTMGAVIGMDGRQANRKETFDIGIAGPLAGLVVAIPILWIGIMKLDFAGTPAGVFQLDTPLAAKLMLNWLRPEGYEPGQPIWQSQLNPYFMAGWIGMFITGLNMMPVSQLDGGHVIYTLFGKRSYWIARAFMLLAVAAMLTGLVHNGLWLMLVVIMLFGTDHPPTRDDRVRLGWLRTSLGLASLTIPVFCFAPQLFIVSS